MQEKADIGQLVREARRLQCKCGNSCLLYIHPIVAEGDRMLMEYMTHWFNMTRDEHREQFLSVVEGCVHGVTAGGHIKAK